MTIREWPDPLDLPWRLVIATLGIVSVAVGWYRFFTA